MREATLEAVIVDEKCGDVDESMSDHGNTAFVTNFFRDTGPGQNIYSGQ